MYYLDEKICQILNTHNNSKCPRDLVKFTLKVIEETNLGWEPQFIYDVLVSIYKNKKIKLNVLQRFNLLEILVYREIKFAKIAKIDNIHRQLTKKIKVSNADIRHAIGELERKNEISFTKGWELYLS